MTGIRDTFRAGLPRIVRDLPRHQSRGVSPSIRNYSNGTVELETCCLCVWTAATLAAAIAYARGGDSWTEISVALGGIIAAVLADRHLSTEVAEYLRGIKFTVHYLKEIFESASVLSGSIISGTE